MAFFNALHGVCLKALLECDTERWWIGVFLPPSSGAPSTIDFHLSLNFGSFHFSAKIPLLTLSFFLSLCLSLSLNLSFPVSVSISVCFLSSSVSLFFLFFPLSRHISISWFLSFCLFLSLYFFIFPFGSLSLSLSFSLVLSRSIWFSLSLYFSTFVSFSLILSLPLSFSTFVSFSLLFSLSLYFSLSLLRLLFMEAANLHYPLSMPSIVHDSIIQPFSHIVDLKNYNYGCLTLFHHRSVRRYWRIVKPYLQYTPHICNNGRRFTYTLLLS